MQATLAALHPLYKQGMLRNMQIPESANERVGKAVARLRKGMSQADLAQKLAKTLGKKTVDPTTIGRIESGKRAVSVDELEAFAEIFGVSVDDLLISSSVGNRVADLQLARNELTRLGTNFHLARNNFSNAAEEIRVAIFDKALKDDELVAQLSEVELDDIERQLLDASRKIEDEFQNRWPVGVSDDHKTWWPIRLDGTPRDDASEA